jgi:hypothetical protein
MSRVISSASRHAAIALIAAIALALVLPAAAANAAAFRYWGYYQLSGSTWQFAPKGPDQTTPADGSVEGWRFAVGTEGSSRTPRVSVTFEEICGDTDAESGKKRVAVVIDYGREADTADGSTPPEPVAHCASTDVAATGAEVLANVAEVRSDNGLVCAIDQFPASGCGEEVQNVSEAAQAPDTPVELAAADSSADDQGSTEDDGSNVATYVGIAVVLLVAAGLLVLALRRRASAGA